MRPLFLYVFIILLLLPYHVSAQSSEDGNNDDKEAVNIEETEPAPYSQVRFPAWSRDIRRGEVIAIGVFPIAMIVTGITYEFGRFIYQSSVDGSVSAEYAPWFLWSGTGDRYDNAERVNLIIASGVVSVGIALADYFIGRREQNRQARDDSYPHTDDERKIPQKTVVKNSKNFSFMLQMI